MVANVLNGMGVTPQDTINTDDTIEEEEASNLDIDMTAAEQIAETTVEPLKQEDSEEMTEKEKQKTAIHAKNPENIAPEGKTLARAILDGDVDGMRSIKRAADLEEEDETSVDITNEVISEPGPYGDEDHMDGVDEIDESPNEVLTIEDEFDDEFDFEI